MKMILAHNSGDATMTEEIHRLEVWAPGRDWALRIFRTEFDLITMIAELGNLRTLSIVEIHAHGTQYYCGPIQANMVSGWAATLKANPGIMPDTKVFLSGCNTGLTYKGICIAQLLANSASLEVLGTRGYLFGSKAEGSDRCTADAPPEAAHPGGITATGSACWNAFAPSTDPVPPQKRLKDRLAFLASNATGLTAALHPQHLDAIVKALHGASYPATRLTGPNAILDVEVDGGPVRLHLTGGGSALRDPSKGTVWAFPEGPALLHELVEGVLG